MIEFKKIVEDDLAFLNEIRNECSKEYLHDSRLFTLEETIDWFNKSNPNFWIIIYNDNKIGYFRTSNYSSMNKNIYLGADLHKNYRGKNLAYLSYLKFIPFLFKIYNLHKISLEVLATNEKAINLYTKLGFKIDGIKREDVLKNKSWIDSIIMSILKKEI